MAVWTKEIIKYLAGLLIAVGGFLFNQHTTELTQLKNESDALKFTIADQYIKRVEVKEDLNRLSSKVDTLTDTINRKIP